MMTRKAAVLANPAPSATGVTTISWKIPSASGNAAQRRDHTAARSADREQPTHVMWATGVMSDSDATLVTMRDVRSRVEPPAPSVTETHVGCNLDRRPHRDVRRVEERRDRALLAGVEA